jgi:lipopolysaccharide/colanic/teichoic acid biosynthesis glycosyltransferase
MLWSGLGIPISSLRGGTVVKRLVDIAVSVALLLIVSPLLALAALLILLTSPGPVLFRQVRMGRDHRPFEIFKLRTMALAEPGPAYTFGADKRITPIGRWLRRSKIDELPQLWNVLWGEMSLVGPRPVLPELTQEFHECYVFLLRARPGLTDPASLKYSQEARLLALAPDPMHFFKKVVTPDKIQMSLEYMRRANLGTDVATMAMTAVICCFPSISRVYGELPEVTEGVGQVKLRGKLRWTTRAKFSVARASFPVNPVNESVFSHELAYLEATVEETAQRTASPWILAQETDFELRSASSGASGSASRL